MGGGDEGVHFLRGAKREGKIAADVRPFTNAADIALVAQVETNSQKVDPGVSVKAVVPRASHAVRVAERLARVFGKRVVWVDTGGAYEGITDRSAAKDVIFIDPASTMGVYLVVGHELGHHLAKESPQAYRALGSVAAIRASYAAPKAVSLVFIDALGVDMGARY